MRVMRWGRLGGLIDEYAQVAKSDEPGKTVQV
jgi:hypothetical protein